MLRAIHVSFGNINTKEERQQKSLNDYRKFFQCIQIQVVSIYYEGL